MSKAIHILSNVVWALTAIAAINLGLHQFGYDIHACSFLVAHPDVDAAMRYVMLAAGLYSLATFCCKPCCKTANCNTTK